MPSSIDLAARLSAVVALQQEVLSLAPDSDLLTKLIVTHTEIASADGASFQLVDGDELVVAAVSGLTPFTKGMRCPIAGSGAVRVLRDGTLVRRDDIDLEPATRGLRIRAAMTAPMQRDGMVVGVIETYSDRINGFSDLDAYALQLVSGIASAGLMLARAFHSQKASEERYRMLFERNIAGVFRTTSDGQILDCNDAFVAALGYESKEQLLGRSSWELYLQRSDRDAFLAKLEGAKTLTNLAVQLRRMDGTPTAGIVNVTVIPGEKEEYQLLGTLVPA